VTRTLNAAPSAPAVASGEPYAGEYDDSTSALALNKLSADSTRCRLCLAGFVDPAHLIIGVKKGFTFEFQFWREALRSSTTERSQKDMRATTVTECLIVITGAPRLHATNTTRDDERGPRNGKRGLTHGYVPAMLSAKGLADTTDRQIEHDLFERPGPGPASAPAKIATSKSSAITVNEKCLTDHAWPYLRKIHVQHRQKVAPSLMQPSPEATSIA